MVAKFEVQVTVLSHAVPAVMYQFVIAKKCKQSKRPLAGEQTKCGLSVEENTVQGETK